MIHGEKRSVAQLREHYEIEKELANRLKNAGKKERRGLYSVLYTELLNKVPHHPINIRTRTGNKADKSLLGELKTLKKYLNRNRNFLELGKGNHSALAFEIAKYVKKVYVNQYIKFCAEIQPENQKADNIEIIDSDIDLALSPESIDIAFSKNLIEHLHPDDAKEQLQSIYKALVKGGRYLCITPHCFKGPSDISRDFDSVASGFHLKEYTNIELYRLFRNVGFLKINSLVRLKGIYLKLPVYPAIIIEYLLNPLSFNIKRKLSNSCVLRHILSICLIARK